MSKYEAVDRMMELATGKRSDPQPPRVPGAASSAGALAEPESTEQDSAEREPAGAKGKEPAKAPETLGSRARSVLDAARPLLPVFAGAMRQADHGAFQAVGRLLPLLGHVLTGPPGQPAKAAQEPAAPAPERAVTELEAAHRDTTRRLDALSLRHEATEDDLRRLRNQVERLQAEHTGAQGELRKLSDRLRLVIVASIVLLMLLLAQLVVTVLVLHR